jgi:hypothetical protein
MPPIRQRQKGVQSNLDWATVVGNGSTERSLLQLAIPDPCSSNSQFFRHNFPRRRVFNGSTKLEIRKAKGEEMLQRLSIYTVLGLSGVLSVANFSNVMAGVNQRERHQQRRIYQGARTGQLNRAEFRRLENEETRVQRHELKARADGEFTPQERARINRELNRVSRDIYRQKHDQNTPGVGLERREANQEKRIYQGVQSGELTPKEYLRLQKEEERVDRHETKALADGDLSFAEKARLDRELNRVSRDIYRQKHDQQEVK